MTKQKQNTTKSPARSVNFSHKPLFTFTKSEIQRVEDAHWIRYNENNEKYVEFGGYRYTAS